MNLTITRAPSFTTSDGKAFGDRKLAVEHEKNILRVKNLAALGLFIEEDVGIIVANAAAIIAALDVKESRKSKAAA